MRIKSKILTKGQNKGGFIMRKAKQSSRRRRRIGVLATLLAIAIIMTGTFAWQSISQLAINNARGASQYVGARLHDDFENDQDWVVGANKDIYMENYSGQNEADPDDEGRPVFVRIQLSEYMEIGEGAGLFNYPSSGTDPLDYQDLDEAGDGGVRTADPNNKATSVLSDGSTIVDPKTWKVHIPTTAANLDSSVFHTYWNWTMGGEKPYMPTFNKDNESLLADRTEDAHNEFTVGATESNSALYSDADYDGQTEIHTAKDTLTTAGVITMSAWNALGNPATDVNGNGYWVGDTDGWFYWSKALMPGEATGLLVNGITLLSEPDDEWYYAIHVKAQSATAGDWGDEDAETGFYEDGITEEALELLDQAATSYSMEIIQATGTGNGTNVVAPGGSIEYDAKVNKSSPAAGTVLAGNQAVKWELDGEYKDGTSIDKITETTEGVILTVASDEDADTIKLKATSQEGKVVSVTNITVTSAAPTVTP